MTEDPGEYVTGRYPLRKIVSGGQTGVDRAALDAAMAVGFPCGGWCPQGRWAEDGVIPERYPVQELAGAGPRQRTIRNVADSDGTAIIYVGSPEGGTALTLFQAIKKRKPYFLIDTREVLQVRAAERLDEFIRIHAIACLNVAGPRGSRCPNVYEYTLYALTRVLRRTS